MCSVRLREKLLIKSIFNSDEREKTTITNLTSLLLRRHILLSLSRLVGGGGGSSPSPGQPLRTRYSSGYGRVLRRQKFQFYRLSVQLTQSPVHTNDPFGFFPATLCNCSSTNDRVTFVFLHEDRIRQFFIVVATCSRGTDSSVMTSIV